MKIFSQVVGLVLVVLALPLGYFAFVIANQEYLHLYVPNTTFHDIYVHRTPVSLVQAMTFSSVAALLLSVSGLLLFMLGAHKRADDEQ